MRPRDVGDEEALNGAVAGAVVTPAGDVSHGDAAGHAEEGQDDAVQLAERGCTQTGLETLE